MRIAIDARELCGQPTGVGRYLGAVLEAWTTLPEARVHQYVLCAHELPPDADRSPLRVETHVAAGRGGTLWEQIQLPRLVRAAAADVLFSPAYTSPLWVGSPVVLAMHDVSFAVHPEWLPWHQGLRQRTIASRAARQAARVLTLTEFSRGEIREWLGVPSRRITVVPPGVTAWPSTTPTGPRTSVLYVGSIFERRHVPELLEGVARLATRRADITLTLVGHNRTASQIDLDGLFAHLDLDGRATHREWIADKDLGELYDSAGAFAFLSEYEGFGLTPLEALAAGVPPVVLDTPVAREAYGPAAIYLPRPEPSLIADALERAIFDTATRARVLKAVPAVLARYSWAECAASVLCALEQAAR